jgi:hypothetical protein
MESLTKPGCSAYSPLRVGPDQGQVIVHCRVAELSSRVSVFRRFALPFLQEEKIGDLELLWTAESLPPPAEDRPEMMMTKPGRQHEEVVKFSALLGALSSSTSTVAVVLQCSVPWCCWESARIRL